MARSLSASSGLALSSILTAVTALPRGASRPTRISAMFTLAPPRSCPIAPIRPGRSRCSKKRSSPSGSRSIPSPFRLTIRDSPLAVVPSSSAGEVAQDAAQRLRCDRAWLNGGQLSPEDQFHPPDPATTELGVQATHLGRQDLIRDDEPGLFRRDRGGVHRPPGRTAGQHLGDLVGHIVGD